MVTQTFERRDPRSLRNHLLSIRIYGQDRPSDDFLKSVEMDGVTDPLVILPDGTIISGHTRKLAAVILKLESVPCLVRHDLVDQPLAVERMVISSNKQRVKTGDILAREASALAEIETVMAEKREKSGVKANPVLTSAQGSPGRTIEKVGEALNIGKDKAKDAIKVGDAIAKAEAAGDQKTADKIVEAAKKSVHAAARLIAPPKKAAASKPQTTEIPANLQPIFAWRDKFRAYEKMHSPAIAELAIGFAHEVFEGGKGPLDHAKIALLLDEIHRLLMPWQPEKVCDCDGKTNCKKCDGRGWTRKG